MPRRTLTPPPRPELLSLVRAAKLHPRDEDARLVLADWLEEHGDSADVARAAFVRAQVRAAQPATPPDQRDALTRQADRLLDQHRLDWLGPLDPLTRGRAGSWERGFLHLRADLDPVTDKAARRLGDGEAVAWLERLQVSLGNDDHVRRLVASPVLPHVAGLVVAGASMGVQAARLLANSPAVGGLVALDLNYNHLGNAGAAALAESPHLDHLETLDLWMNSIGARGAEALAAGRWTRLRAVNLGGNALRAAGVAALADSPVFAPVETLLIWGNNIGLAGTRALAQSRRLTQLHTLYLNENRVGRRGAEALAAWPQVAKLRLLSVWGNQLGPAGAAALAAAPLGELTELLMSYNRIGDEGAVALANAAALGKLESLDLRSNQIGDAGARALLASPALGRLKHLSLEDNPIAEPLQEALAVRFPKPADGG